MRVSTTSEYIRGEDNIFADVLSRGVIRQREYEIKKDIGSKNISLSSEGGEEKIRATHAELGHPVSDITLSYLRRKGNQAIGKQEVETVLRK